MDYNYKGIIVFQQEEGEEVNPKEFRNTSAQPGFRHGYTDFG
jgi:hypothetical protein